LLLYVDIVYEAGKEFKVDLAPKEEASQVAETRKLKKKFYARRALSNWLSGLRGPYRPMKNQV
jgi:hypothetical protein